jgi:hypothetical protein
VLVKELENFKAKVTVAASDPYELWREGQHDDLVLAVALACWEGERRSRCGAPQVVQWESSSDFEDRGGPFRWLGG